MDRWVNKIAIVTGASAGIGASIAEKLVQKGVIVVGLARRSENVEQLAKKLENQKGKLYACKTDISNEEDIIKAFKWVTDHLGPVSILINNAGVVKQTTLIDGDIELWKQVLNTNVLGLCIATREAVRIMKENKIDGHIIHINSIAGHSVPDFPFNSVYPASKHAVTALTETLRQELNHIGSKIKITSVSPGAVKTEIGNDFVVDEKTIEFFRKIKLAEKPLESEDVAEGVLYVLSTPPHVQVHELIMKPIGEHC